MGGWEEELAVLLRELGVTQEEPQTHLRPPRINEAGYTQGLSPVYPKDKNKGGGKRQVQSADALFWGKAGQDDEENDHASPNDLSKMRREVESIVVQIVRLMQHGDLDTSLKEDVLVVLRALRRRATATQQAAASELAYLEFAAAMLHFCRLVLRLSEVTSEDV